MDSRLMRAIMGPLEGVTSPALIRVWAEMRLTPVVFSPFLRISEDVPSDRRLTEFIQPYRDCGTPYIIQLMGTDPARLGAAARRLAGLGVTDLNLNFGCPSMQVVRSGAGGGMLRAPEKLLSIVREVKNAAAEVNLSVKLRSGYAAAAESARLLPILDDSGALEYIILHHRTVLEQYLPIADAPERRSAIKAMNLHTPLIVNGDINDPEAAQEVLDATNGAGVMCARGFLRDPFLLNRIITPGGNFPSPSEARESFFTAVIEEAEKSGAPYSTGAAIELSNLVFGSGNPFFAALKISHRRGVARVTVNNLARLRQVNIP